MENYDEIIAKARELSELINNHEITRRYLDSLEKMKDDAGAQKLLSELVMMGRNINNSLTSGDSSERPGVAEMELLKAEFEKNETVKNHLLAQREYLNLISMVQERIKNPVE
ncbi:MAG TPA: YlbF family regulator [Spirochaetota bacterium]|nr:YlbF family regulator [Spirochaetota bacterium]HPJ34982.1 YlbF family regulator [Spirochaetota bacterium]